MCVAQCWQLVLGGVPGWYLLSTVHHSAGCVLALKHVLQRLQQATVASQLVPSGWQSCAWLQLKMFCRLSVGRDRLYQQQQEGLVSVCMGCVLCVRKGACSELVQQQWWQLQVVVDVCQRQCMLWVSAASACWVALGWFHVGACVCCEVRQSLPVEVCVL